MTEEASHEHVNTVVVVSDGKEHRAAVLAHLEGHEVAVYFCRGGLRSYFPRRGAFQCLVPTREVLERHAPITVHPALLGETVRAFLGSGCPNVLVTEDERGDCQLHHCADWM